MSIAKKRRISHLQTRLENQLRSGIINPNGLPVESCIKLGGGEMTWYCEGSCRDVHEITLTLDEKTGNSVFKCTCSYEPWLPSTKCRHITGLIVKLVRDQANFIDNVESGRIDHQDFSCLMNKLEDMNIS